jgi:HAD superfamily hydrolase (TIGR01490 family)
VRLRRRDRDAAGPGTAGAGLDDGPDAAAEQTSTQAAGEASAAAAEAVSAGDPPVPDPTAAAFFDLDNTLLRGASIYYFARGLSARGFFTSRDLVKFVAAQARFRVVGKEMTHEQLLEMREEALSFVKGKEVAEIVAFGEEIWDELMADKVWSGTVAMARAHLDAGQRVWIVTATPIELAQIVARRLGLTGALGTVAEVRNGHYTGRLVGEPLHGPAKAAAIRSLSQREGLELRRCTAYSDSANDVPMLSAVGTAVAVNPDPELRRYANEQDWQIRDVRTGRKVARIAIPAAAGTGALTGAVVAGMLLRRRRLA